jgi:DMSO reductase family type II enzyme chaperone
VALVAALASLDRAVVYRGLARLFHLPDPGSVEALRARELPELRAALGRLGAGAELEQAASDVSALLADATPERIREGYEATFEASGGLRCAPNETPHTADTASEAMLRTYQLADIAGFYRAFGVEVEPGGERPDHITAELEFMHLLAVKEAVAADEEGDAERAAICRDAAASFLRDHLGGWVPRLAQRLDEAAADPVYAAAGRLLERFVALDAKALAAA